MSTTCHIASQDLINHIMEDNNKRRDNNKTGWWQDDKENFSWMLVYISNQNFALHLLCE